MKILLLALLLLCQTAFGATVMQQPTTSYFGGLLVTDNYIVGDVTAPSANTDLARYEYSITLPANHSWRHRTVMPYCTGAVGSNCYVDSINVQNYGAGLATAAYHRVDGEGGTGPSITLKTAVRGPADQWAVWAHQYALGPGTKVGLWIGGDSPYLRGLPYDTVSHIMVVAGDVNPTQAVLQWNAVTNATGDFLRVYRGDRPVFEVTSEGVVRAKRFENLP